MGKLFLPALAVLAVLGSALAAIAADGDFGEQVVRGLREWNGSGNITLDDAGNRSIMVMGSRLNGIEHWAIDALKKRYPGLAKARPVADSEFSVEAAERSRKPILLVGGPSQNSVTRDFIKKGWLEKEPEKRRGLVWFSFGKTPWGAPIIVVSDARGYRNMRTGGLLAPLLKNFIPERLAPLVATIIGSGMVLVSVALGAAGELLPGYARTFAGKYLQFLGRGDKKLKVGGLNFTVFGLNIKAQEMAAILIASSVFAAGMAWLFAEDGEFLGLLAIGLLIAAILYYAREMSRIVLSHWQKLETEFHFWFAGSAITLMSAALGAMCNATYYVVEDRGEDSVRKSALIKMAVEFATVLAAGLFFFMNFQNPDGAWQMFFVSASTLGAIETLPAGPLPGAAIVKWNRWAWLLTFAVVWGGYVLMNFVL